MVGTVFMIYEQKEKYMKAALLFLKFSASAKWQAASWALNEKKKYVQTPALPLTEVCDLRQCN